MNNTGYELSALAADEDETFGRPVSYGTATPAQREAYELVTEEYRITLTEAIVYLVFGLLVLAASYAGWPA